MGLIILACLNGQDVFPSLTLATRPFILDVSLSLFTSEAPPFSQIITGRAAAKPSPPFTAGFGVCTDRGEEGVAYLGAAGRPAGHSSSLQVCVWVCVCVRADVCAGFYVCVCVRERERERRKY